MFILWSYTRISNLSVFFNFELRNNETTNAKHKRNKIRKNNVYVDATS